MKDLLALFGLTATPAAASEADAPRRLITRRRLARDQYTLPPSFTDLLPWCEYLPEHQAFLHDRLEPVLAERISIQFEL